MDAKLKLITKFFIDLLIILLAGINFAYTYYCYFEINNYYCLKQLIYLQNIP